MAVWMPVGCFEMWNEGGGAVCGVQVRLYVFGDVKGNVLQENMSMFFLDTPH